MKLLALISIAGLALLSSAPAMAAPTAHPDVVPNQYIITLKPSANLSQFSRALQSEMTREGEPATGGGVVSEFGHKVSIGSSFKAVVSVLSKDMVRKLKANGQVAHVEPDRVVRAPETPQLYRRSWSQGLALTSHQPGESQGNFDFADKQGEGVDVFVLDSGVMSDHVEFRGVDGGSRATNVFDATGSKSSIGDIKGHGTMVAGIAAGVRYGVAKRAHVRAVKVTGSLSSSILGMEFAAKEILMTGRGKTAVCNMSFAVTCNPVCVRAMEKAVAALFEAGCVVVKAAGNDRKDACNVMPAGTPQGLTVAALAADGQSIAQCAPR